MFVLAGEAAGAAPRPLASIATLAQSNVQATARAIWACWATRLAPFWAKSMPTMPREARGEELRTVPPVSDAERSRRARERKRAAAGRLPTSRRPRYNP